ncbi:hypothetical protein B0T11DRAFT_81750 [Plectosphaerella cucumerina]|uniref:Uncharacterized protein n=1 Tax=Plectosphaerella cucumerina TaxID=40658 RepID=A0A8K0TEQ5_9PEZI|nr:hypothetical protein B0T11DRAFT_81750 [Plectosphaerella cucumerina]
MARQTDEGSLAVLPFLARPTSSCIASSPCLALPHCFCRSPSPRPSFPIWAGLAAMIPRLEILLFPRIRSRCLVSRDSHSQGWSGGQSCAGSILEKGRNLAYANQACHASRVRGRHDHAAWPCTAKSPRPGLAKGQHSPPHRAQPSQSQGQSGLREGLRSRTPELVLNRLLGLEAHRPQHVHRGVV